MATHETKSTKRYLRKKQLAARYSTCVRTVDRTVEDGRLPSPDFYMGKSPLWLEDTLEACERSAMKERDHA